MRDFRIISTDRLTEDQQKQIEHILRECDQEFVPPISERTSTSQTDWSMEEKERGVAIYLKQLIKQHMLLAVQEEKVAGFLSYQDSFNCPSKSDLSLQASKFWSSRIIFFCPRFSCDMLTAS